MTFSPLSPTFPLLSPEPTIVPTTQHIFRNVYWINQCFHVACILDIILIFFLIWPLQKWNLTSYILSYLHSQYFWGFMKSLIAPLQKIDGIPVSTLERASQMGRRDNIWWRASAWFHVFSKGSWQNESRNKLSRWWESSAFAIHLFMFFLPSCQFQLLSPIGGVLSMVIIEGVTYWRLGIL